MGTDSFILRRIIKAVGIVGLALALGLYVTYQARNLLQGPTITLTGPYTPIQHEDIITFTGTTKNIVKLTLNGREIHTQPDGTFTQELVLEHGYSIISLNAHDRFGRETAAVREYVYYASTSPDEV